MKNLLNLGKVLTKTEQKSINGGAGVSCHMCGVDLCVITQCGVTVWQGAPFKCSISGSRVSCTRIEGQVH